MVAQMAPEQGALERLVVEEVRGLVDRLQGSQDANEAEGVTLEWSRHLGREVLERTLQARVEAHEQQASRPCGCGGGQQVHSRRARTVLTLLGAVRVVRAYWRCAECGRRSFPADGWLGWKGALRERLEEAVAHEVAGLPYRQALAGLQKLLGVELSLAGAQAIVARWGEEPLLPEPYSARVEGRLLVALDGTTAQLQEGWKEVKVGVLAHWEGETAQAKSYVADWASVEGFAEPLWREALGRGAPVAAEVAVIGDGASAVWTLAQQLFPRATEILDCFRAREHLWEAGKAVYPEGSAEVETLVGGWVEAPQAGHSEGVQEDLRAWAKQVRDPQETLRKCADYLETHQARTRYPQFREAGWPIGSGVVESACKDLIALRFKRKSTRWSRAGATRVLHLRLDRFNERWEARREHQRTVA